MINVEYLRAGRELLERAGAPPRLIEHGRLVGECAGQLVTLARGLGAQVDVEEVVVGASVHDIGKARFVEELSGPGSRHESAGEVMLREMGVSDAISRKARTHAAWDGDDVGLEDLLVALSDKLWKGKRVQELEERVLDAIADSADKDRWELFEVFQNRLDAIADAGSERVLSTRDGS